MTAKDEQSPVDCDEFGGQAPVQALHGVKVLFVTTVLPRKKRMGSEVASQLLIDALGDLGAIVTVVGYVRPDDEYRPGPGEIAAGRRYIETRGAGLSPLLWLLQSVARGIPYSVAKYRSDAYVSCVRDLLRRNRYDFLVIDHVQMSWLIDMVPLAGRLVGVAQNVEHQMYKSFAGHRQGGMRRWVYERESRLLEEVEMRFLTRVHQLWVLTKDDARAFASGKESGSIREMALPGSPGPSNVTAPAPSKDFDVGLVGSWSWKANEEGLRWFLDRVYPRLSGDLTIRVAGSGAQWLEGRYDNVKYLGFVDDAQEFLRRARVVAIPTFSGGGIQIKTLDAIASGSMIVATPLALRGIDDHPPSVAVAETPEQFAARLCSAIRAPDPGASVGSAIEWSQERRRRFRSELTRAVMDVTRIE